MFFLLRSAACIGVVFCMLPDAGGSKALHVLASDGGRLAVGEAERYCTANPDCLRMGASLAAVALSAPSDPVPLPRSGSSVVPGRTAGPVAVARSRLQPKG